MLSMDVIIWTIRQCKGRAKPYELCWKVGTEPKSKSFLTKALADLFRADLLKAATKGKPFDTATGLPGSMAKTEKAASERQRERAGLRETGGPPVRTMFALVSGRNH